MSGYTISVWLHIVAATAWVGSMIFFAAVLAPMLRKPESRASYGALIKQVGGRYRVLGWVCLVILVITGVTNIGTRYGSYEPIVSAEFWRSDFGRTLFHKLILVALVVAATLVHDVLIGKRVMDKVAEDPTSKGALRARRIATVLGRVTLLLSLAVLLVAVALARGLPA